LKRRHTRRADEGETLVEILVAVVILGLGAVAVLAGFQFAITASTLGRNQSTSDAYVRSVAEAIQTFVAAGNYKTCAAANSYVGSSPTSSTSSTDYYGTATTATFTLPHSYTISQAKATAWNGTAFAACGTDYGVQQIVLVVKSTGTGIHQATEQLTVTLRRPCNAGPYSSASPC